MTTTAAVPEIHPDLRAFLSKKPHQLLIGGQWVDAASSKTFSTFNPADGEVLGVVAEADHADVDAAVKSARKALEGPWGKMSPAEREKVLHKIADLIEKHADELAQ